MLNKVAFLFFMISLVSKAQVNWRQDVNFFALSNTKKTQTNADLVGPVFLGIGSNTSATWAIPKSGIDSLILSFGVGVQPAQLLATFFLNLFGLQEIANPFYLSQGLSLKKNLNKGSFTLSATGIWLNQEDTDFKNSYVPGLAFGYQFKFLSLVPTSIAVTSMFNPTRVQAYNRDGSAIRYFFVYGLTFTFYPELFPQKKARQRRALL